MPPPEAGGGAPTAPDTSARPEARYTREQVISAFNTSLDRLQRQDPATLRPEQRWARKVMEAGKEKTLDQTPPTDKFRNEFRSPDTGRTYRQQEGIPVDGLINFLTEQIDALAEDAPERADLENNRAILLESSREFTAIPIRMHADRLVGRIAQEAQFISQDPDVRTGSMTGDYFKARDMLLGRRELVLPPIAGAADAPAPSTPPTETAPTPGDGGPTPSPAEEVRERRYDINVINAQEAVSKNAQLEARKDVTASLKKGKWWQVWHWPRKIGLRLIEPGEVLRRRLELQKINVENNTSYLTFTDIRQAALNATQARAEAGEQQRAVVERFKEGNLRKTEDAMTAEGPLRTHIINEVLRPITEGRVTSADQVRRTLAAFVENHLDDTNVQRLFGADANNFGDIAEYFATDLLETGLKIKADLHTHGETLEHIDNKITIRLGNARLGAQTEVRDAVDRAVAWANRKRSESMARGARGLGYRGVILNPLVVGIGASLATAGVMRSLGYASKLATPVSLLSGGLAGAVMGGARRYYELGVYDRPQDIIETTLGEKIPDRERQHSRSRVGRLLERMSGGYRREDLEKFHYDQASVDQLIKGGGAEMISGMDRRSVSDLLSLDLTSGDAHTQVQNREALARRIAEIATRLDLSSDRKIDLVKFSSRVQADVAPTKLTQAAAELRRKLIDTAITQNRNNGMSEDAARTAAQDTVNNLEARFRSDWESRLIDNQQTQDRRFQRYRLRNAAGAAAMGGVTGIVGGFVSQEVLTFVARANIGAETLPVIGGMFKQGDTVREKIFQGKNISEWFDQTRAPGFALDTAKELYKNPGATDIGPGVRLITNPGPDGAPHSVQLIDTKTNLPLAGGTISPDGKITLPSTVANLDPKLKFMAGPDWQPPTVKEDPNFNATKLRDIWEKHPATVKVGDNLIMKVGRVVNSTVNGEGLVQAPEDYPVTFTDIDGRPIPSTPMYITPDKKIIVSGNPDELPIVLKDFMKGWQTGDNITAKEANLFEQIKATIDNNRHHTFRHGNTEIDLNTNPGSFSIKDFPSNTQVHGVIEKGGLVIDPSIPGNPNLQDIAKVEARLKAEGWNIQHEVIPGQKNTGSVVDALLQRPDILKQVGIIETDQVKKEWNFHVLRPDLVSAKGIHTHNELTLHVGGEFTVTSGNVPEVRTGMNPPGFITFNGNIDGGLIPSHLDGVPPATDRVLNDIIKKSGGLKYTDMMMVFDLKDGNQVMAKIQEMTLPDGKKQFGVKLPDGLYQPNGQLIGIESIATAVVTDKNGTAIKADALIANGVPEGSVVHSLASERFGSADIPPAPNIPDKPIIKITPPKLREFIPPPEKPETVFTPKEPLFFDQAEMIPIPFTPRHPLSPLETPMGPLDIDHPYYYENRFPPGTRLNNLLRRGSNRLEPSRAIRADEAEGRAALAETRTAFDEAERIYVVIDGAIGDSVISSGYLQALQEALRVQGKSTPITIITNRDHGALFDGLSSTSVSVIKTDRGNGLQIARDTIRSNTEQKTLVMEFTHFLQENPTVTTVDESGKRVTVLNNLLAPAVLQYNNDNDGNRRYSHFVEELFSLSKDSLNPTNAKPKIILPPNKDDIYDRIATEVGIDKANTNQIAIVLEASIAGKRYSLEKWGEVLRKMNTEYPGYQFNIIFNSGASAESGAYSRTDIENAIRSAGVTGNAHIVDGNGRELIDIAVLLERQRAILSNDTGLAHIGAALESGPQVVTLYMPQRFKPTHWVSALDRQKPVTVPDARLAGMTIDPSLDGERDESKKPINLIEPDDIMTQVRTIL